MIQIDLQPEVEDQLAAQAKARGVTISEYLSYLLVKQAEQSADQGEPSRSRKRLQRSASHAADNRLRRPKHQRPHSMKATNTDGPGFAVDASVTLALVASTTRLPLGLRASWTDSTAVMPLCPGSLADGSFQTGLLMALRRGRIQIGRPEIVLGIHFHSSASKFSRLIPTPPQIIECFGFYGLVIALTVLRAAAPDPAKLRRRLDRLTGSRKDLISKRQPENGIQ